jgi:hypothetical protein
MSFFESFLVPETIFQWGILCVSAILVFIGFHLLPFKWRKQVGLIQIIVLLVIVYLGFVGAQYVFKHDDAEPLEKVDNEIILPEVEHWVAMQVKVKALNLRRCKTTYCDSIALLPIGTTVMVDLNSNDKNWLSATVVGKSGYVSSIYLERTK